jgi:hypothetical protein
MTLLEQLARHFFGAPNEGQSKDDKLRFGTHGSKSIDLKKGCWFDHETNEGGGPLDLIKREMGLSNNADCWSWAEREGFEVNGYNHRSKEVDHYDYTDENGKLLFQVIRYANPKRFLQRRPNGHGGWEWERGPRIVPYRLPELREGIANEREVYIPEGEKDVNALRRWNLVATCNPGGGTKKSNTGGGKFSKKLVPHFVGADIVVIADNDDVGHDHAADVASKLLDVAQRVRVLDIGAVWPECPVKGDISDWIAAGLNAEQFKEIVEALPDYVEDITKSCGRMLSSRGRRRSRNISCIMRR